MARSMLGAIAEAAGLDNNSYEGGGQAEVLRAAAPAPVPAAPMRKAAAAAPDLPAAMIEIPEATAYMAALAAKGHQLTGGERGAVITYGHAWQASADIRHEFTSFDTFAAYMRARHRGGVKIFGNHAV